MVKKLIQKSLILAALIMLAAYTVPAIFYGGWKDTLFLYELLLVSGLICVAQLVTNLFKSNYLILEIALEYLMVILIVGIFGLLFGWYKLTYLWIVLVYVTPVYIIGYLLDLGRTRRDVEFINERIRQRAERGLNNGKSDDNSQGSL